jgi:hypothetical protein
MDGLKTIQCTANNSAKTETIQLQDGVDLLC